MCNKVSAIDHMPTKIVKSRALMMKSGGNNMGLSEFYDRFVTRHKAREVAGLSFDTAVPQAHMLSAKPVELGGDTSNTNYVDYLADIQATIDEQFYASLFLHNAGDQYKDSRTTLDNNFTMGSAMIPSTVKDTYTLLENFLKSKSTHSKLTSGGTSHNDNKVVRT